jgi:uncharacterized protein (DUF2141 family)
MKTKLIGLTAFFCIVIFAASVKATNDVTLTVIGTDLKSTEGQLVVAVFNSPDSFLEKPIGQRFVKISDKHEAVAEFSGLPPGTYAVSAFHDKNADGKLNTIMAAPREDYGFSNNARGFVGPPSFRKASFEIQDDDLQIAFRVH